MKKILLLGGSTQQIIAIQRAKQQGYYTVLCDYLPDNPGKHYAEKYYCISTTDEEAILKVAQKERVNGVIAYASDPASATAAYVADKLGLPSNPYQSVKVLARKDLFRKFLAENNFNCPCSKSYSSLDEAKNGINFFRFPVMVKPVDSSGSQGVSRVTCPDEFEIAFKKAMRISRVKVVIVEECIEQAHPYIIGGDCFVLNGKVEYWGLLNCHRDLTVNPLVPAGKSYPLLESKEQVIIVQETVQRVVDLLKIKFGAINLELMFDKNGNLFLIEMGPRNGGNMIPDFLQMITGVDLVKATVETALGNMDIDLHYIPQEVYYATYIVHSSKKGKYYDIKFDSEIEKFIIRKNIYMKEGDPVAFFDAANKALGILFLKFSSMEEMLNKMSNIQKFINIVVQ